MDSHVAGFPPAPPAPSSVKSSCVTLAGWSERYDRADIQQDAARLEHEAVEPAC